MKTNRSRMWAIVLIIVVLAIVYYLTRPKMIAVTVVEPPAKTNTTPVVSTTPTQKQFCYFNTIEDLQNKNETVAQFASINYDKNGAVSGIINYMPTARDSTVGDYNGTITESSIDPAYPSMMNVIYTAMGDGVTVKQQQIFLVGPTGIKQASGEIAEGKDRVYRYKDVTKLTYKNPPMPVVDCASVPKNLNTDYMTTKQ